MKFRLFKIGFILMIFCVNLAHAQLQSEFPTDKKIDSLKSFWIKVFSEFDDSVTIIHDEENTDIIYKIVNHPGFEHFQRKKFVDKELKKIKNTLRIIVRKKFKKLNEEETELLSLIPSQYQTLNEFKKLAMRARSQQGMSNRFKEGLKRSLRFMDSIKEVLVRYNLPAELAYLPHVESSFNYFATSKVGAAGIWQLMPRTARTYKLKVSKNLDERLDPIKSTEVAIKLLRDNYKIVRSWPLAITAYNHGTKNINKTIKQVKSFDPMLVLDSINKKSFQFASKNFYPSYLAAVEISSQASRYFPDIQKEKSASIEEFILDKRMNIEKISNKIMVSKEDIKQFNPQITGVSWKKNFTLPQGFIIKYPAKVANITTVNEHFLSFDSVKKWFDELCGIVSQSIASNFER